MWEDMMAPRGRVYMGSEMAAILHGEGIPPETIEALLTSTPSPACPTGPRPMMNFEPASGSTTPDRPLLPHPAYGTPSLKTMMAMNDSDLDDCGLLQQYYPHTNQTDPKKRRLTSDQVQFLERSFEAENKLEPERKAEIARSLGLQPRQVAIWFQNRRARWKTKQLEKDYEAVRAGYEGLKREYEVARKEKEKLEAEVNYLREQLLNRQNRRGRSASTEIQRHMPGSIIPEGKMKISSESEASALCKQGEMIPHPHEEPAETDQSELDHVEEASLDCVAAAAAAACRYGFPAPVDDHHPLWPWHPAEFCGP